MSTTYSTMTSACHFGLLMLILVSVGPGCTSASGLCSRCQSMSELRPLTAIYRQIANDVVTFQTFVKNLNALLDNVAELSALKPHLNGISAKYDDCIRTCSIAFVKRSIAESDFLRIRRDARVLRHRQDALPVQESFASRLRRFRRLV